MRRRIRAWSTRHPFLTSLILFCLFLQAAVLVVLMSRRDNIPEQQLEALKARTDAAEVEKNAYCQSFALCRRFGLSRLKCSVAGDFDSCIRIMMGEDLSRTSECTNEGELRAQPPDRPYAIECLIRSRE
jgi:hypothetical protein